MLLWQLVNLFKLIKLITKMTFIYGWTKHCGVWIGRTSSASTRLHYNEVSFLPHGTTYQPQIDIDKWNSIKSRLIHEFHRKSFDSTNIGRLNWLRGFEVTQSSDVLDVYQIHWILFLDDINCWPRVTKQLRRFTFCKWFVKASNTSRGLDSRCGCLPMPILVPK